MTNFLNWLKTVLGIAPVVLEDVQPIVTDAEAIVALMEKVVADLKASNFSSVIADSKSLADAVQTFAMEVETVITQVQAVEK